VPEASTGEVGLLIEKGDSVKASVIPVVSMSADQLDAATGVMARAFQNDPLFKAIWPDSDERAASLSQLARWDLADAGPGDMALVTAGPVNGVAKAIRSDVHAPLTENDFHRLGHALTPHAWQRFNDVHAFSFAVQQLMTKTPEAHWYLQVLAVSPEYQGRGIGSALLDAIHAGADADGLPTTLLTFQPRNVPLYQRNGFQVVAEGTEPGDGLYFWCMKREPRK
jgi:ribosomal protein S18 acetylase RimI-like enzyme